ncbi:calcium-binding protein, partial [Paracoccus sp. SY]|uniref:calcium-binding protein n=1 Tax=Paracoccus sp. SY TaxID=1330255 RepID=UPI0011AEF665
VLGGTEGNDTLRGDLGIDALWGDGGDDYLNAGQESDQVFGGDGDDIIEDPFGDNFLRGERGNDVISAARGINLLFGGEGHDALMIGQDGSEAFGGDGNDFILGGSGGDNLLGNEGDDWIEGGEGFDVISGDNSELFFNSTIIGHDVAWGQGNDQDYDLESGDDIAFSGIGVQRFEGMFGFDWAIAKYDVAGVNWDANIRIFTSIPAEILRDRFDMMESFSGWKFNDTIRGDNRGTTAGDLDPNEDFGDHVLDAAGLARINGMTQWFGGLRATLAELNPAAYSNAGVMFRDGNMLLGGGGSDLIQGRGGFDVIDGDAWLNVRIKIVVGNQTYSAESLNGQTAAGGPFAGKVWQTDSAGNPRFDLAPAFGGRSLQSLLLDRTIKPGDMSIVRELIRDQTPGAVDTALFSGNQTDYVIEGRGQRVGNIIQSAYDVNGDGFISVTDTLTTRGVLFDDTDFLKNIERLQFADGTIDLTT